MAKWWTLLAVCVATFMLLLDITVVNVARRHGVDPEAALQSTNAKFVRRFEEVARRATASGREVSGTPLEELDALWDAVKLDEVKTEEKP